MVVRLNMNHLDDEEYIHYNWEKLEDYMSIFEIYYGFFNGKELVRDCVTITYERDIIGMFNIDSTDKHFTVPSTKDKPNHVMHIVIDRNYQGLGITKILMRHLIHKIRTIYPAHITEHTSLSIVGDASGGFWNHIGMVGDEYYKEISLKKIVTS